MTTKQLDVHEQNALLAVDEAVGDYAAQHGTDMATYSSETRLTLWKLVVFAWGESLRMQIKTNTPPF